jgi:hypothetical protein
MPDPAVPDPDVGGYDAGLRRYLDPASPPQKQRPSTVGDAIDAAAARHGLDPATLKGIASIESSWNPDSNRNKATQYKGLFQMGTDEWRQYGGKGDVYNAADNADAAARMLSDHSRWFQDNYGRSPNPGELYMMHQQGRGHFTQGALTNVAGNPYPGMQGPQTPESFRQGWAAELDRRMAPFGGAGPSTAVASDQTVPAAPTAQTVAQMPGASVTAGRAPAGSAPPRQDAAQDNGRAVNLADILGAGLRGAARGLNRSQKPLFDDVPVYGEPIKF